MTVELRRLGKTGLNVSVVGFGAAPVGFLETEREEVKRLLNTLLDQGVNLIDTAASYMGAEEALGETVSHRRAEFVLVSKCGKGSQRWDDEDWSPDAITASIDRSLQRLKTDHIDVMLLHTCDLETLQRGEALAALVKAREAGKIRFVGYSGDNEAAAFAATLPDVAVIETSVNLCDQANIAAVLPAARHHDIGVIAKRPIANAAWKELSQQPGLYAGYAKTYHDRFRAMDLDARKLGIVGDPGAVWAEVALRFTLSQEGVTTAIIGTTNPVHLVSNLAAAAKGRLHTAEMHRIRTAFLEAEAKSGQRWPGQT